MFHSTASRASVEISNLDLARVTPAIARSFPGQRRQRDRSTLPSSPRPPRSLRGSNDDRVVDVWKAWGIARRR